jgi:hypothetical protein
MLIETNKKALRIQNNAGETPLAVACVSGSCFPVMRELVLAYPEALKKRDIHGHTPVDLLWSSFAKTLPGASSISNFLKAKAEEEMEMSPLLTRFHQKISLCLAYSYALSQDRELVEENNSLLCHAIISEELKHCPHQLLAIFLTHEDELGYQVDEDGNTALHYQIIKRWDDECISVILDKCKRAASISNNQGMLPLHLALEEMKTKAINDDAVRQIVSAYPEGLETKDPNTAFHPFISAGIANNLQLSYEFLLQSPNTILNYMA